MALFEKNLLQNQAIIITGGGTGLGRAMGLAFAGLGASLVLASRKKDNLDAAAAEMRAVGAPKVLTVACDVRKPEEVQMMVDQSFAELGTITGLVNNAAGNFLSPTENLSPNGFNAVVGIVLNGTFHCTQAVAKKWIANKTGGRILNIVTTYAWTGSAYVVPSACAKAGVLAMTRSLAVEWAKYQIRLNAIAPGPFPTPGAWQQLVPPGAEEKMLERIPLGRFGKPEELAHLAAYLMSPYADYINGEVITLDGGEWLKGAGQFNWAVA